MTLLAWIGVLAYGIGGCALGFGAATLGAKDALKNDWESDSVSNAMTWLVVWVAAPLIVVVAALMGVLYLVGKGPQRLAQRMNSQTHDLQAKITKLEAELEIQDDL